MSQSDIINLPVYGRLSEIADTLTESGTALLHAEPGAGKTTLVPWHLLSDKRFSGGKILLLQPRRVAARAAAERIASLLGEKVGESVGIRTRLETVIGPRTRLEVVTEGILTRILQNDQSLGGYGVVIFDEFHERSINGDLALTLAWDCRENLRPDLRIMLMSATLPAAEIQSVFGSIPMISVPGRCFPVSVFYKPQLRDEKIWDGAARLVREALRTHVKGDLLVFLPGHREIRRTAELLGSSDADILVLHGNSTPDEQRSVLSENTGRRRIILATNVAETSLTIPGVTIVIDTGFERRVRFSPSTGMDHWDTVPVSAASAEQRKGRAGRLSEGFCLRWRHESEQREKDSRPEISEADLSPLTLECAAWGSAPNDLKWLTPPPAAALRHARELLDELGFLSQGKISAEGLSAAKMALHPRLAKMMLDAEKQNALETAAVIAAVLEEGDFMRGSDPDLRERITAWKHWRRGSQSQHDRQLRRIDTEAKRILRQTGKSDLSPDRVDEDMTGLLLLSAYPDRAAQQTRSAGANRSRLVLANGRGAFIQGALADEEFLIIADLDGGSTDGRIFLASPVSRSDLEKGKAGQVTEKTEVSWNGWRPSARTVRRVKQLILAEKQGGTVSAETIDIGVADRIKKEGIGCLPWNESTKNLRSRAVFVRKNERADIPDLSDEALADATGEWLTPFLSHEKEAATEDIVEKALSFRIGWENIRHIDAAAPEKMELPSGSSRPIDYESGEIPVLAARLQEFFGCIETPKLCGVPLLLHLLSPAGRPVQITRDLDGFWDRAYPDVKKELAGRYPKHVWPENPREAEPTSRAKPRK